MIKDLKVTYRGIVKTGEIHYYSPTQRRAQLALCEGMEVIETIEEIFDPNTQDQYGFYHGGIIRNGCMQHEQFGGWDEIDIEELFEKMFLMEKKLKQLNGETVEIIHIQDVKKLGKRKMAAYLEKILNFLATLDIHIQEPGEYIISKYRATKDDQEHV